MSEESSATKAQSVTPQGWGAVAGTIWAALIFLGPRYIVGPVAPLIASLPLSPNSRIFVFEALIDLLVLVALVGVIKLYRIPFAMIGLTKKLRAAHVAWALVALPLYFIGSLIAVQVASKLFIGLDIEAKQEIGFSTTPQGAELILVFIALVIVPPFVEELVFRGFLLRAYDKLGAVIASLLVSLCFALLHSPAVVSIDVFVLSMFLCYLRLKTNSLWPAILLHASKNLVAFLYLFIIGLK